ncbi:MAG: type II toxin-antitoxin system HicA family toxin [Bacteroidota bacterium]
MPYKLRRLSGMEVLSIFKKFGFAIHSQKGSHAKLRRINSLNEKQTLTIPIHTELDKGTLRAIVKQANKYISDAELTREFYTE